VSSDPPEATTERTTKAASERPEAATGHPAKAASERPEAATSHPAKAASERPEAATSHPTKAAPERPGAATGHPAKAASERTEAATRQARKPAHPGAAPRATDEPAPNGKPAVRSAESPRARTAAERTGELERSDTTERPKESEPSAAVGHGAASAAPTEPLPAEGARISDPQVETLARSALASSDREYAGEALKRLETHHFKSSQARERELVLFVQGMLEDRLGKAPQAAATFHRLEQAWPQSTYLAEGQAIMAEAALEHKRYQEAESRLHKALGADMPAESQRRAQELLLWTLAEQGRSAEGVPVVQGLKPLGTAKPSERGLVGIMEALCAGQQRAEAETILKDYRHQFHDGPHLRRMELDWAKLLGQTGDAEEAARSFQRLIQAAPAASEADEARLALATLLTDGKLPSKDAEGFPTAKSLLGELQRADLKGDASRQATLVKLRIAMGESRWQDAIGVCAEYRAQKPSAAQLVLVDQLRVQALCAWTQSLLGQHQTTPLLRYLDRTGILSLTPALRLDLTRQLAAGGLPEAAQAIVRLAPPAEQTGLRKAAQDNTMPAGNPRGALALLPAKGGSPRECLMRAQASLALHDWDGARAALPRARPGPERIQGLLAYLERPAVPREAPEVRRKEVETWLARAPEKGEVREPLVILAADLRVGAGNWQGALALYPAHPQPGNQGWVALMRATCQAHLGHPGPALETLEAAKDIPAFKNERQALQARLVRQRPPKG
jgi:tetratricopeptide (TPR) repeat protein